MSSDVQEKASLERELAALRAELEALKQRYNRLSYRTVTRLIELSKGRPAIEGFASLFFACLWSPWNFAPKLIAHKMFGFIGYLKASAKFYWWCFREARGSKVVGILMVEHLGDIVACEPLARKARHDFPGAKIVWFVDKKYRELLDHNPNIDFVLALPCLEKGQRLLASPLINVRWQPNLSDRGCKFCPVSKRRLASKPLSSENYFHFGSLLSVFSYSVGLLPLDEAPTLFVPKTVETKVDGLNLPKHFLVFHRMSNDKAKEWPNVNWEKLSVHLKQKWNLEIVEVGHRASSLSILESAEVIRRSLLFVGIDSGPAHLANAHKKDSVILMGKYKNFPVYQPFSGAFTTPIAKILRADGPVSGLSFESVAGAVDKKLEALL